MAFAEKKAMEYITDLGIKVSLLEYQTNPLDPEILVATQENLTFPN